MKNAILKFSLTALATLTLAACGSSGGSGNSQSVHTPSTSIHTPDNSQNNSAPNKNISTPPVNVSNANNLEIKNNDKTGDSFIISEENKYLTSKK